MLRLQVVMVEEASSGVADHRGLVVATSEAAYGGERVEPGHGDELDLVAEPSTQDVMAAVAVFGEVAVEPGVQLAVRFDIPVAQLGFYDADLTYVVEAGEIEVLVGTSSADLVIAGTVTIDGGGPVEKAFDGSRTVT